MNQLLTIVALTLALALANPALAQRAIGFAPYSLPAEGAIVVPVALGDEQQALLSGVAAAVNERTSGGLAAAIGQAAFTGAVGETLSLYSVQPYSRIDLIGVGADPLDRVAAENFGGRAAMLNDGRSGETLQLLWSGLALEDAATAARVGLGFRLGDYRFDRYQQKRIDPAKQGNVKVLSDDQNAAQAWQQDLEHLAGAIYLARNLASEPANIIFPESFRGPGTGAVQGRGQGQNQGAG